MMEYAIQPGMVTVASVVMVFREQTVNEVIFVDIQSYDQSRSASKREGVMFGIIRPLPFLIA